MISDVQNVLLEFDETDLEELAQVRAWATDTFGPRLDHRYDPPVDVSLLRWAYPVVSQCGCVACLPSFPVQAIPFGVRLVRQQY